MASVGPPTSSVAELIAREDYQPQLYLAERKEWSFTALRNELNTCLDDVRSQLVELINHDYQDFIDLSRDLRGMEPVLDHLQQPLLSMQQTVEVTPQHSLKTKHCLISGRCRRHMPQSKRLVTASPAN